MSKKLTLSESAILELYRVSLENVEQQSEIITAMTKFGYGTETIAEGKNLYNETVQIFELKKTERDERNQAYKDFSEKMNQLDEIYTLHRKMIKILFKNDHDTLIKLGVIAPMSSVYNTWIGNVKLFYKGLIEDESLYPMLARLNLSIDEINAVASKIADVELARANYILEKGESENATKAKDAALVTLGHWMSDFYAVARIALEDKPLNSI